MRASPLIALVLNLGAVPAFGAELTRVASSFEPDHPFGFFLDASYERTQTRGLITREWYDEGRLKDVAELRYTRIESALNIDAHLGLYRDLELHFALPVIFQDDESWGFAGTNSDATTTLYRNCLAPDGSLSPTCPGPGLGSDRLFNVDESARAYRGGLGDITFGLGWAAFNEKKDPTKATWALRFDYTAPTAAVRNPSVATSASARGALGDGAHRFTLSSAFSKRFAFAEPYTKIHYTLPFNSGRAYANCDNPDATRMAAPGNCGSPHWSRAETALTPAHRGGGLVGMEVIPWDNPEKGHRFSIDLQGAVTYVSAGRYANEMSAMLGKLLTTGDYLQVGGQVGLVGHFAGIFHLKVYAGLTHNTEHTLTDELVGKDLDAAGTEGAGKIDVMPGSREVTPSYDWRIDRVGRRFRVAETTVFRFAIQATLTF